VSERLHDHDNFRRVVQTLAFEFFARLAPNDILQVRTYTVQGHERLANQITFTLQNGRRLTATYHSNTQTISVRDADAMRTLRVFRVDDDISGIASWCRTIASPQIDCEAA
jgi:hypothetical protein